MRIIAMTIYTNNVKIGHAKSSIGYLTTRLSHALRITIIAAKRIAPSCDAIIAYERIHHHPAIASNLRKPCRKTIRMMIMQLVRIVNEKIQGN